MDSPPSSPHDPIVLREHYSIMLISISSEGVYISFKNSGKIDIYEGKIER